MRESVPDTVPGGISVPTVDPPTESSGVPASATGGKPQPARRAPLNRSFQALLGAFFIANLGAGITSVAFPWLGTELTRDPLLISGVVVAAELPWLLFSIPVGALIDRSELRWMISLSHLLRAVVIGTLAVAVYFGGAHIALLYAVAFAIGTLTVTNENATQTVLPRVVPSRDLERANGQLVLADTAGGVFFGPALGGALLFVSASLPFFIDAGLYLVAAGLMLAVVVARRSVTAPDATTAPGAGTLRSEMADGLRYFWRHRVLRQLGLLLGVLNLASAIAVATQVLFAQEILGLNSVQYGALFAVGAVGAAAGAGLAVPLEERLGARRVLLLTLIGNTAVSLIIGTSSSALVVGGALSVGAALAVIWNVLTISYRQRIVPDQLLGRVNSIYRLLSWGPLPLGSLLGGLLVKAAADLSGNREVALRLPLFIAGTLTLVAFGYAFLRLREGIWSADRSDYRGDPETRSEVDAELESTAVADPQVDLPAFGGTGGTRRPVLWTLVAINLAVTAIGLFMIAAKDGLTLDAALYDGISRLHEIAELNGPAIDRGEVWRLITPMFVHYGVLHLIANMVMLVAAGWKLERVLGSARFLALYLLSGLGAGVATYFLDHDALTAGASGANFGTFSALLVVCLRLRLSSVLAVVLLVFGIVTTFAIPGMAIVAHGAGLLIGAVVALGYALPTGAGQHRTRRVVPLVTLVVLLVLAAIGVALH